MVGATKLLWNRFHNDPEIGSIAERPPTPPQEEPPEPKPFVREPQPEPAPQPKEPEVDWTHAKVVFLIPEKVEVGGFKGLLLGTAENVLSGIATRKIFDVTGGKVTPQFVFKRTKPARYMAVSETLEADGGIFILVARQDVGFLKGIAVKKIESTLPDKLKKLPIEVIFERTQPDVFAKLEQALLTSEPQPKGKPDKPKETGFDVVAFFKDPKTYTLSLLGGLAADRLQFRVAAFLARRRKRKVTAE